MPITKTSIYIERNGEVDPMGRMLALLWVLAASAALVVGTAGAQKESRVALIIGNARYQHAAALNNAVNDALAMADAMRDLGFEVVSATDADRTGMVKALGEFRRRLRTDGVGLFYYAGHGIQARGRNYLIPIDADISDEKDAALLAIDLESVQHEMEDAGVRLSLFILDACRDNPFGRRFRSAGSRGLAEPVDVARGTLIAFATSPGSTAADGTNGHGLYTAELLKAIVKPGLALEDVFKQTAEAVEQASGKQQTPWYNSAFHGEFYVSEPTADSAAAKLVSKMMNEELLFWWTIAQSKNPEEFEEYLRQFPSGRFVGLAHIRIDALQLHPAPAAENSASLRDRSNLPNLSTASPELLKGVLALRVSPAEAVLSIDGKPAGSAADFRQVLPAGSHELEISADGYLTHHEMVSVPAGGERDMELALAALPPPPPVTGTLELEVSPVNARLKLDGTWVGDANGFRRELPAGKHPAEISAPGYQALAGDIVVEVGKILHRRFDLVMIPPPRPPAPRRQGPTARPQIEPGEPRLPQSEPVPAVMVPRSAPQATAPPIAPVTRPQQPIQVSPPAAPSPRPTLPVPVSVPGDAAVRQVGIPPVPTFDCAKPESADEIVICGRFDLKMTDAELGAVYQTLRLAVTGSERDLLKSDQVRWLQQRHEDCGLANSSFDHSAATECFARLTSQRIGSLRTQLAQRGGVDPTRAVAAPSSSPRVMSLPPP